MGNIESCCSVEQINNVDKFTPFLSRDRPQKEEEEELTFPELSEPFLLLVDEAKSTRYYKSPCEEEMRVKKFFRVQNDKVVYKGDQADGYGCVSFPGGSYFEGKFVEGQPINGVLVLSKDCFFVGDILNCQAHGWGVYKNKLRGYHYEGEWKKNLPHCKGEEVFTSEQGDDRYIGGFIYGNKFGEGIYQFANGNVYEGGFYNGYSDGHGKLTLSNGESYEGEWKLGSMHGKGTYKWPNGEKYEGFYQQGVKHGAGQYHFNDGTIYQGQWEEGLQHGEGTLKQGYDEIVSNWAKGQQETHASSQATGSMQVND